MRCAEEAGIFFWITERMRWQLWCQVIFLANHLDASTQKLNDEDVLHLPHPLLLPPQWLSKEWFFFWVILGWAPMGGSKSMSLKCILIWAKIISHFFPANLINYKLEICGCAEIKSKFWDEIQTAVLCAAFFGTKRCAWNAFQSFEAAHHFSKTNQIRYK